MSGFPWHSTPAERADRFAPYFEHWLRLAVTAAGFEWTLTRIRRHVKKYPDQRNQLRQRLGPAIREVQARLKERERT